MAFLAPGFLWLLVAVPAPFLWAGGRRHPAHATWRALAIALLALALARPAQVAESAIEHHVFVLDRSLSVAAADADRALTELRAMRDALPSGAGRVVGVSACEVTEDVADSVRPQFSDQSSS